MKNYWLQKNDNENLIIFFSGWGCDYNPFLNIKSEKYDVLMFYDYKNFDDFILTDKILKKYKKTILLSWSMGVFVSNLFANGLLCKNFAEKFDFKIAINGTLKPIDDKFGIPKAIYKGTLNNFNEITQKKFFKRMCGKYFNKFLENESKREIIEQKEELKVLQNLVNENLVNKNIFDFILISTKDKIFPFENLVDFWNKENYKVVDATHFDALHSDAPHFIFYDYESWDDLINETTTNCETTN